MNTFLLVGLMALAAIGIGWSVSFALFVHKNRKDERSSLEKKLRKSILNAASKTGADLDIDEVMEKIRKAGNAEDALDAVKEAVMGVPETEGVPEILKATVSESTGKMSTGKQFDENTIKELSEKIGTDKILLLAFVESNQGGKDALESAIAIRNIGLRDIAAGMAGVIAQVTNALVESGRADDKSEAIDMYVDVIKKYAKAIDDGSALVNRCADGDTGGDSSDLIEKLWSK